MGFATKVKARLAELQLSQAALAKEVGVSRQQVSNWLRGESTPSIAAIVKIARHLDLSLDYLLDDSMEMPCRLATRDDAPKAEHRRDPGQGDPPHPALRWRARRSRIEEELQWASRLRESVQSAHVALYDLCTTIDVLSSELRRRYELLSKSMMSVDHDFLSGDERKIDNDQTVDVDASSETNT